MIFVILVSFQNDISESSMLKLLGESVHGFFGGALGHGVTCLILSWLSKYFPTKNSLKPTVRL